MFSTPVSRPTYPLGPPPQSPQKATERQARFYAPDLLGVAAWTGLLEQLQGSHPCIHVPGVARAVVINGVQVVGVLLGPA